MSKHKVSEHKYLKPIFILVFCLSLGFICTFYFFQRNESIASRIEHFFQIYIRVSSPNSFIHSDTTAPIISIKEGPFHTLQSRMSISLKSDEEITLTSTQNKLVYLGDVGVDKYYVLEISGLDLGERIVEAVFQDNFANKTTKQFDIARTPLGLSGTIPEDLDWPNATYIKDGNSLTAPANKGHKLSSDFQPVNLVNLRSKGLTTNAEELQLTGEAAEALVKMTSDLMAQKGKGLIIASGYRSYNTQVQTYLYWVSLYGQEHADTISARPGFSEHQLGTTLDFMSPDSGYDFVNTFDQTVAGQWLLNNSYKYGFVQSYPYGKSDITGYQYEAWHYRFIGTNQALEWKESGLTLKQYLEQQ